MKPYLLGQGVFHFVNGLVSCPSSNIFDNSVGSSSTLNPSFLCWKQQDQLILSALLSSLSVDVLHLVVDCSTSHCVWHTLEKTLASPSNSRIMQLHSSFQDQEQLRGWAVVWIAASMLPIVLRFRGHSSLLFPVSQQQLVALCSPCCWEYFYCDLVPRHRRQSTRHT